MTGHPGLGYGLCVPPAPADGAPVLVLLHGRGADRHDLLGLAPFLPPNVTVATPEAPHEAAPWGYGPGWAWYRYAGDDHVFPETLAESLDRLDGFLDDLPGLLPATTGPVILGGFSQGGTTSLAYALTRPGRVGGVAVLSGFLVDAPELVPVADGALAGIPVFWGHGRADPAIPHELGERGRARLREIGAELTIHDHPGGHGIAPGEVSALAAWISG